MELPPRARRIRLGLSPRIVAHGTTSACAENTVSTHEPRRLPGNYLRVRGEYRASIVTELNLLELPPRARRILPRVPCSAPCFGTTSACAENTSRFKRSIRSRWNYLRVRGEYILSTMKSSSFEELPPRARRILSDSTDHLIAGGTTSACAENTRLLSCTRHCRRNYLRVRGEYGSWRSPPSRLVELPPRARRILSKRILGYSDYGTTSACAENTSSGFPATPWQRNYLRVRGEYGLVSGAPLNPMELPPRARRIPVSWRHCCGIWGTTSACAENTLTKRTGNDSSRNYLRVRGEYTGADYVNARI